MGAGDHALYVMLAKRFKELGHNVLLDQDTMARNDEVLDVFWRRNPNIDGLTDRKPDTGYPLQGAFYDELQKYPEGANLEVMERVHGLPPPYSIAPEVYYKPGPFYQDLSNVVLWDYSALSSAISEDGWSKFMEKMNDRFGFAEKAARCVLVQHKPEVGGRSQVQLPGPIETIGITSIYQYLDMLAACRGWVGSEAGGQALAAAIRGPHTVWEYDARPEIVCLMTVGTRNSRAFCYRTTEYRDSLQSAGDDYLQPAEVPLHRYHVACKINGAKRLEEWRAAR